MAFRAVDKALRFYERLKFICSLWARVSLPVCGSSALSHQHADGLCHKRLLLPQGPFNDKKALLAALLLRDRPTADIRPSSSVNNKERVRFDCSTPGCEVSSFSSCVLPSQVQPCPLF